jgi:hypothetical protein
VHGISTGVYVGVATVAQLVLNRRFTAWQTASTTAARVVRAATVAVAAAMSMVVRVLVGVVGTGGPLGVGASPDTQGAGLSRRRTLTEQSQ